MSFCAICAKPTTSNCSRCRIVYYCGRECQKIGWRSHKTICNNFGVVEQKSCNECSRPAEFSCNDCSNGFYCSENCQVRHWEVHQIFHSDKNTIPSLKDISTGKVVSRTRPSKTEEIVTKPNENPIKFFDNFRDKLIFNDDNEFPNLDIEPTNCPICMENVNSEYEACFLDCDHIFHCKCMEQYENTTNDYKCPLCRRGLYTAKEKYNSIKEYSNIIHDDSGEKFEIDFKTSSVLDKTYHNILYTSRQGNRIAAYNTGLIYANKNSDKHNIIMALKWFFISLYKGYKQAERAICMCYHEINDIDKLLYWLRKCAEYDSKAQYELAICYREGKYIDKNEELMIKYLKMAADNGHSEAQLLSYKYYRDKNIKIAINYLLKSYKQNNSSALLVIANYYMEGLQIDDKTIFKIDFEKGLELIDKSHSLGNKRATEMLVKFYITSDLDKAYIYINQLDEPYKTELLNKYKILI